MVWSAVQCAWSLRYAQVLHNQAIKWEDVVSIWIAKLEAWRSHRSCSVTRKYLSVLTTQLLNWQVPGTMFALDKKPKDIWTKSAGAKQMDKQQKYAQVKQQCMQQIAQKPAGGYIIVFTDDSAKVVRGMVTSRFWGLVRPKITSINSRTTCHLARDSAITEPNSGRF